MNTPARLAELERENAALRERLRQIQQLAEAPAKVVPVTAAGSLASRIRRRREALNLTPTELAKAANIGKSYVAGLEAGKNEHPSAVGR